MEDQDRTPRTSRRWRLVWAAGGLCVAATAAAVTGVAVADPPGSAASTTVYACVGRHDGNVRIVAQGATCRRDEDPTSWSSTGPQGPAGPAGATGPQGPAGAAAPDPTPRAHIVGHMSLTPGSGDPITFDIEDYSAAQQQSETVGSGTGGAGAGKVSFQPISVSKHVDASSPKLFTLLASGAHLVSGQIQLTAADGTVTETVDLRQIVLASLTTSNSGAATDQLHEQLTLQVGAISLQVGGTTGGWDVTKNTGS